MNRSQLELIRCKRISITNNLPTWYGTLAIYLILQYRVSIVLTYLTVTELNNNNKPTFILRLCQWIQSAEKQQNIKN